MISLGDAGNAPALVQLGLAIRMQVYGVTTVKGETVTIPIMMKMDPDHER